MKFANINQAFSLFQIQPLQEVIKNPIKYFDSKSSLFKKTFNIIAWLGDRYTQIRPSQGTIARLLGCSREHVNRILNEMERDGLIKKTYRHLSSCIYRISGFFNFYGVRKALAVFFSAFKYPPLFSLFNAASNAARDINVTQLIKDNKNYYNNKQTTPIKGLVDKFSIREESSMTPFKFDKPPISSSVGTPLDVLRGFGLIFNQSEEEELMALPQAALVYAIKEYQKQKSSIRFPFRWLLSIGSKKASELLSGAQPTKIGFQQSEELARKKVPTTMDTLQSSKQYFAQRAAERSRIDSVRDIAKIEEIANTKPKASRFDEFAAFLK